MKKDDRKLSWLEQEEQKANIQGIIFFIVIGLIFITILTYILIF